MYVAIVIGLIIAALVLYVTLQPNDFTVTRSAAIAVPASQVFPLINNFHLWDFWSPWAKLDPQMKTSFDGAACGKGAVYSWAGNKEVGEGKITITESQENERICLTLEFFKPFRGTNFAEFTFDNLDQFTHVTWTMTGKLNFITKSIHQLISMDRMIGSQFEQGLANLNSAAQKMAQV